MNGVEMGFLERLKKFEPVQVRAVLTAVVVAAGAFGLELSPWADRIDVAWLALFAVIPVVQGWITRKAVTPNAVVVERVEGDRVVAGEANDLVPEGLATRLTEDVVADNDGNML